jgi:16S rRNA U516 pseudouridylate synthase RsuA-like enzyme
VHLGNLKPGRWRHLTKLELEQLKARTRRRRL